MRTEELVDKPLATLATESREFHPVSSITRATLGRFRLPPLTCASGRKDKSHQHGGLCRRNSRSRQPPHSRLDPARLGSIARRIRKLQTLIDPADRNSAKTNLPRSRAPPQHRTPNTSLLADVHRPANHQPAVPAHKAFASDQNVTDRLPVT